MNKEDLYTARWHLNNNQAVPTGGPCEALLELLEPVLGGSSPSPEPSPEPSPPQTKMTVILDAGHGMNNRKTGVYDPGATSNGEEEASIAMQWVDELREILMNRGYKVIRTRIDAKDPAPVSQRAVIAKKHNGDIMLSIHCNAANGSANGTETFYRGQANKAKAQKINDAVRNALYTKDRGVKLESDSQHSTLAVMAFQPCFLIELGFIDNASDREKMTDPVLRRAACVALAEALV